METFAVCPQSASLTEKPRLLIARYSDGYEQRAPDGLHPIQQVWQLSFLFKGEAPYQALVAFLRAHQGSRPFRWQPPGETESQLFRCSEWTPQVEPGRVWRIQCTFEQVFDSV
ncbi:putative phage Minor tail protein M [Candidatus Glomeribacter gigasporarum BEG34]|uniref:Putative phage Minor tail protein M n=1 Tax=Candidatus Glomeribacter gigasporarum BEG34 TaxID=1070319 RepID=G2JAT8_9BURK|nr:phage tail protein [Candidatus Glomeribacter gigasporarum]CCD29890.1 putative phage Minor tail protein M [Candidatus Glomeribacter gigasporarum BEG34]